MAADAPFAALEAAATVPPSGWTARYPTHRPMAALCSYVPEELIHAAGFTPVRVLRKPPASGAWGAHLQSFTCPLVRSLMEQGLDGDLSGFAGVVFAHSCDAMQALADIWRLRFPDRFVWIVNHPTRLDGPRSAAYLLAELQRFQLALESQRGAPTSEDSICASIALHQRIRALLAELDGLRDRLAAREFYAAALAAQTMPKEVCAPLLEEAIAEANARPAPEVAARVLVAGAVLDDFVLPDLADELGIRIVGDDLCTSARYFGDVPMLDVPPLEALARRSLERTPCAVKHRDGYSRGQTLLNLAHERGAQGIVFYLQKFCEPHAFDFGQWQCFLREHGLPVLLLEDDAGTASAQWRTRLQAFTEMLARGE
jgi:benzoyl-CoA reductase/2-hydroxyglutaryl-CoA dehydratase subunit BcrC/BadD/HgdB